MKVLALDFDGVITVSAPECFRSALRTVVKIRSDSGDAALLADLEGMRAESARRSVVRHPTFRKFDEVSTTSTRRCPGEGIPVFHWPSLRSGLLWLGREYDRRLGLGLHTPGFEWQISRVPLESASPSLHAVRNAGPRPSLRRFARKPWRSCVRGRVVPNTMNEKLSRWADALWGKDRRA